MNPLLQLGTEQLKRYLGNYKNVSPIFYVEELHLDVITLEFRIHFTFKFTKGTSTYLFPSGRGTIAGCQDPI